MKNENLGQLFRILKIMKKNKYIFVFSLILSCIAYPIQYVTYGLLNRSLTNAVIEKDMGLLYNVLGVIIVVTVLACIVDPLTYFFRGYVVRKVMCELRNDIFKHIIHLPMKELDHNLSGNMMSIAINDINSIENAFRDPMRMFVVSLLSGVVSGVTIFILNWKIAIIILVLGLCAFGSNVIFAKKIKLLSSTYLNYLSSANQILIDFFNGIKAIRIFGNKDNKNREFHNKCQEILNVEQRRIKVEALLDSLNFLLSVLNFLGIFIISGFMMYKGEIDIGTVMVILTLQNNLTNMFLTIGSYYTQIQVSLAGAQRLFNILDIPEEDLRESITDNNINMFDTIKFENVSFSYNASNNVLENLSMNIEKGSKTALVGKSGSGKSTILKLLLEFYIESSGNIRIGDWSQKKINLRYLRDNVAYVSQEPYLFKGTIIENIRYGNPNASMEEIEKSAKFANAHDFILNMENGYDTQIAEGGNNLSGGQRQRIAIARAFLKNASIILLDEATSALDGESEQLIQDALDLLMKGKTAIVVAHRISTIMDANKIIVFHGGKMVEQGCHEELMRRKGIYYGMCNQKIETS